MLAAYLVRRRGGHVEPGTIDIGQLHTRMMDGEVKEYVIMSICC
jgi:hypothetical protein